MTRVHFTGPGYDDLDPADSCLVCLMLARGAELDATEDEWKRLAGDGHDEFQKWYAWDAGRYLIRPKFVDGISDMLPGVGRVPLCWDHLGGLVMPKPSSRLANGPLPVPPGLRRGKG